VETGFIFLQIMSKWQADVNTVTNIRSSYRFGVLSDYLSDW